MQRRMNDMIIELTNQTPSEFSLNDKVKGAESITGPILKNSKRQNFTDITWINYPQSKAISHAGYYKYLAAAWNRHYSVVLKPDDIWNIILNELTTVIKTNSGVYASLFTTTPNQKQEIIVLTGDVESINPLEVVDVLKTRVPSDVNAFLPEFSTTTDSNKLANSIVFCDLVSPYYNYCTTMCGIPNILILGDTADWLSLANKIQNLTEIFKTTPLEKYLIGCQSTSMKLYNAICGTDTVSFFKNIFSIRSCGSGGDQASGWILSFLMKNPLHMSEDVLPSHISSMHYTNLETRREFDLYSGLFHSVIENNFLVPDYYTARLETFSSK